MKKILFMLFTVLVACKSKQEIRPLEKENIIAISKDKNPNYKTLKEFQGDTLKYLETNFLQNRDFYKGKPLDILLNDLEIDIQYCSNSYGSNLYLSNGLSLNFHTRTEKRVKIKDKKNPLVLTIDWETPLPQEKIIELLRKNNGQWTEEEKNYYGQNIIKEIGMVVPNY
ncbi:hypothetical protein [Flavobacterium sp. LM4]|uniref:hypothetical protein n=1 Tax=Flavobacterium sp. LM4 TaxID=1938609 RepID=UPI000991EE9C|nr:hypothetical protein [Flavobacterium sp. LM4]OOV19565.1 hypothetical protein BXU10_07920 [Flavobacterium sp. LM4]